MSIKREPVLQPLSRDHLIALFHAYRLVQASSGNARFDLNEAIEGFKIAWREEIAIHFADEERLFPEISISAESLNRLFKDHAELRNLILKLYLDPSADVARELGELLDTHVRWEEHSLFPEIEAAPKSELEKLETATVAIEKSRNRKTVRA